jgi:hypothetical protein
LKGEPSKQNIGKSTDKQCKQKVIKIDDSTDDTNQTILTTVITPPILLSTTVTPSLHSKDTYLTTVNPSSDHEDTVPTTVTPFTSQSNLTSVNTTAKSSSTKRSYLMNKKSLMKQKVSVLKDRLKLLQNEYRQNNLKSVTANVELIPATFCNLQSRIQTALSWQIPEIQPTPFKFELTREAAEYNWKILCNNNMNLPELSQRNYNPLMPGTEFRPASILEPIFLGHPLWDETKSLLVHGATAPIQELSEEQRLTDLEDALNYGNHKSAIKQKVHLLKELESEVTQGWQLPLALDAIRKLPEVIVAPLGMVLQSSIDEHGNKIEKRRMTHDQSMAFTSQMPVNKRIKLEEIQECKFGFTLRRIINQIVAYRYNYPTTPILIAKTDFKSAYRRLHQEFTSALQSTITTIGLHEPDEEFALVCLRSTFGNAANPSLFSLVSESVTDLANIILSIAIDQELPSSRYDIDIQEPSIEKSTKTFGQAKKLLFKTKTQICGYVDVYLDDTISVILDLPQLDSLRGIKSQLLAIDCIGRPNTDNEPLPRTNLLSKSKMTAEGKPAELAKVLGWLLDTHTLTVHLPEDKYIIWTRDIDEILNNKTKSVMDKSMESLIGRLQHAAVMFTPGKHFLSRLYSALSRAKVTRFTRLSKLEIEDLKLWKNFLKLAFEGVSMNLVVQQEPDIILLTDASTSKGLGGYNVSSGKAWRLPILPWMVGLSINTLEFMSALIALEVDLIDNKGRQDTCYLIATDNTAAMGWLKRSNFDPNGEQTIQLALARHLANRLLENKICLSSQWIAGHSNCVADALSRKFELDDIELTKFIQKSYPSQVPQSFKVFPCPDKAFLQVFSSVQHELPKTASCQQQESVTKLNGEDGKNSFSWSALKTLSSVYIQDLNESPFCPHTWNVSAQNPYSPFEAMAKWHRNLVRNTSPPCQRPLPLTIYETHDTIWTDEFRSFYKDK